MGLRVQSETDIFSLSHLRACRILHFLRAVFSCVESNFVFALVLLDTALFLAS